MNRSISRGETISAVLQLIAGIFTLGATMVAYVRTSQFQIVLGLLSIVMLISAYVTWQRPSTTTARNVGLVLALVVMLIGFFQVLAPR